MSESCSWRTDDQCGGFVDTTIHQLALRNHRRGKSTRDRTAALFGADILMENDEVDDSR